MVIWHLTNPAQAEAEACAHAIYTAVEWGMIHVQVESDSQNIIRVIQCKGFDLAP
jgi:ribonuclease HI